ncbi:RDD family protein [Methylomicrobium sp. Wu6]|uniref:RDD family protein n=1 Tax=Methylomicrobium sp. Wu6 TaxID=3107928 RepID=UPI002DD640AF|nr:RDD family protein [Methylomicrobium sp. Wu6]MEC4748048.1 RDD family protein [Methylomicrobium sp. Wu6]
MPGAYAAPGLFRRLAAIVYDAFLLVAVLFVATAAILPFNAGVAFTSKQFFYPFYLTGVSFLFYAWFWMHGGQTLGMRAWKIIILTNDGHPINWHQAALRFVSALVSWLFFGLGFWWILFDKQKRGWHDYWSKTTVYSTSDAPAPK